MHKKIKMDKDLENNLKDSADDSTLKDSEIDIEININDIVLNNEGFFNQLPINLKIKR